ncbi:MAG: leucine-rich repeat domain-containing protein [Clostridiales bacterium]|jgi:hypothetical protein|nr:leucine-rich repeat domain-containing protein [Clostridiales bacterium]
MFKHITERATAIFIALSMVLVTLGITPATVNAEGTSFVQSGEWEYAVDAFGNANIWFYNGADTTLRIPTKLDGLTVTTICGLKGFSDNYKRVKQIIIPDTVTIIGERDKASGRLYGNTFSEFESLESIEIPNSVNELGFWAFADCVNLKNIALPSNLRVISTGMFSGCTSLSNVVIPDGVTSVDNLAFEGCTNLLSINIPDSVKNIGVDVFKDTKVTICAATYSYAHNYAFENDILFQPTGEQAAGQYRVDNNELAFGIKTQLGSANDGVVFPSSAKSAPYIYFGTYDHVSRLEQPTANRSATTYTQDDIKREGFISPILWQMDDVSFENDRISLSSEYVLDTHVYNGSASKGNDYRTSDIRTWLNGDFITQAFAGTESGAIMPSDVEIKLYDFNSLPLKEVEPAEIPRIAYGDKVYLPDMPSDGAPLFQKDNGNKGAMTWTRTWTTATQSASGDHAFSSMLGTSGTATVTTNRGIAPLTALKYSSVLYLSEISAMAGQGKTAADAGNYSLPFTEKTVYDGTNVSYFGEEAVDFGVTLPAKYYKLTLLSPLVKLTSVLYNGIPMSNGNTIQITNDGIVPLTASAEGNNKIVYKIVQAVSGERKIVGYGEGSTQNVNVSAKDLSGNPLTEGGDYTLYVWAQMDNPLNSNEGSTPMFFKLEVSGTAGLAQ